MCSLQLLAVDKFGSVHVSSPVPDSKFQTKKNMAKETRTNIWKYIAYNKEENSSRCLIQEGHKQCGKTLKESLLLT